MQIRTYSNRFTAESAAEFLRRDGVFAFAVSRGAAPAIIGLPASGFGIEIAYPEQREAGLRLLDDFDRSPPLPSLGWEGEASPDLSRLDPDLWPHCPACGETIDPVVTPAACAACAAEADAVDLILEQHGPDALASCYTDAADDLAEVTLESFRFACGSCQYSLDGLGLEGLCPECGAPFSKPAMLRALLGRI